MTRWVENQALTLTNIYVLAPPTWLESINPLPWIQGVKSKTKVVQFYQIHDQIFSVEEDSFQREQNPAKLTIPFDDATANSSQQVWDDQLEIKLNKDFKYINVKYIMISEIISEIGGTQAAFVSLFGLLFSGMFARQLNKKM